MTSTGSIRLILARHGNTFEAGQTPVQVGLKSDMPLTQQGLKQAHDLASYLKREKIDPKAIYAGSLKRQAEAAGIIGSDLGIADRVHVGVKALNEVDYGLWEGLTSEEIHAKWPWEYEAWNGEARWSEGIFGGSLQGHLEAIAAWLDSLCRSYRSGDVIVGITSNGVIRFFYSFVKDEWADLVQGRHLETLKVKTGHYCELLLYKDKVQIVSWNQKP